MPKTWHPDAGDDGGPIGTSACNRIDGIPQRWSWKCRCGMFDDAGEPTRAEAKRILAWHKENDCDGKDRRI